MPLALVGGIFLRSWFSLFCLDYISNLSLFAVGSSPILSLCFFVLALPFFSRRHPSHETASQLETKLKLLPLDI